MGKKRLDLVGQKFSRLEVIGDAGNEDTKSYWNCICDCGTVIRVVGSDLKNGHTKSCGCLSRDKASQRWKIHGQSESRLYTIWCAMLSRCYNTHNERYKDYGGRGIKVCDRWRHSFENFYADMGECLEGMTLERINNDGDYEPGNCRWATRLEQGSNKRNNDWLECKGNTKNLTQWARHLGIQQQTLWARLYRHGWSVERALTTPVRGK
jgi:hypothetical protein